MRVAICAKSPWEPAVRREHALALSVPEGIEVVFVEAPVDVRGARRDPRAWVRGLRAGEPREVADRVTVVARSAPVPGHRGRLAAAADNFLLRRTLEDLHLRTPLDAVVVQAPWQWGAVAQAPFRRVFDAADDWTALIPARAERIGHWYRRITAGADAVTVAAPTLRHLFVGGAPVVVPNGVDPGVADGAPTPRPGARRMAYLGTLSERFDTDLVTGLLDLLPGWHLDLHGTCRYAGSGDRPSAELAALLERPDVTWHGPVERAGVPAVLDAADVLLIPNRRNRSEGQSSMKLLDYAARGRPVVTTAWDAGLTGRTPPGTSVVTTPEEAAAAVLAAPDEPARRADERVAWAREQSWATRWPLWAEAVFGVGAPALGLPRTPAGPAIVPAPRISSGRPSPAGSGVAR